MGPLHRVIIDTDPALVARPDEIEVMLLSITYGNVEVQSCLRNAVTLFHVIEKELKWRKARDMYEGFDTLKTFKPIVAVGADHALEDEILMADFFHGSDGLGGIHTSHPHLSPSEAWKSLFLPATPGSTATETVQIPEVATPSTSFIPSQIAAHKEILRLLRDNPKDTITIVAIGPLTNLAMAAAEDPETFLRVKEVVVMGGAIERQGNITPVAEFNTYADATATARVFALTSPTPASTMPSTPPSMATLPPYPAKLSRTLNLTLFPLDITSPHTLKKSLFEARVAPLVQRGSPLAEWVSAFMAKTFEKISSIRNGVVDPALSLHDPLCMWYILTQDSPAWMKYSKGLVDIRVETAGQWTRGMHVVDRRNRRKPDDEGSEISEDTMGWLSANKGNRINRIVSSPGEDVFGAYLLEHIFGQPE